MILKDIIKIVFIMFSFLCFSQNKVCENKENNISDLNTIGKCAIEKFKNSKSKEYVQIKTRKRYIRKKNNYITNIKKNLHKTASKPTNPAIKKSKDLIKSIAEKEVVTASESDFIRFDMVSEIPVFIGCADYSVYERPNCVKETFVNSILDNLVYPFDAASEGIEGRVWVRFIICKEGYVNNVTTTGPDNGILLENEAKRLVKLLPKFMPGKHNDKYVNVEYFLPIDFQLDE